MPPNFFKDAHSSLNNKFVPRFSLNLGGELQNTNSDDSSNNIAQNASEVLHGSPLSTSTAPSTATSSRFFLSGPVDKSAVSGKHLLSSSNNSQNDQQTNDNRTNNSNETEDSDDDLQITEVRNVEEDEGVADQEEQGVSKYEETLPHSEENYANHNDQSSSDLLMEALSKSQRVCGLLKGKLEEVTARSKSQEDEIYQLQRSKDSMRESFKKFKLTISHLEQKSTELNEIRKQDFNVIKTLKSDYDTIAVSIDHFKAETTILKKKVDHLQQLKLSTKYEIDKRNKEISQLQKKLDETAGFLSEQKIKTSELEKTLKSSRKDYDKSVSTMAEKSLSMNNDLLLQIQVSQKSVELLLKTQLESSAKPLRDEIKSTIKENVDDLSEKFSKLLTFTQSLVSDKFDSCANALHSSEEKMTLLGNSLREFFVSSSQFDSKILGKLSNLNELLKTLSQGIETNGDRSFDLKTICESIKSGLEELDKDIKHQDLERVKIGEIEVIKNQLQSNNKQLEAENQRLEATIESLNNDIYSLRNLDVQSKENHLNQELEIYKLKDVIISRDSLIESLGVKLQQCKTNCDSKIKTQMEVCKIVSQELETAKEQRSAQTLELTKALETKDITTKELEKARQEKVQELKQLNVENSELHDIIGKLKVSNETLEQNLKEQSKSQRLLEVTKSISDPDYESTIVSNEDPNDLEFTQAQLKLKSKPIAKSKLGQQPSNPVKRQLAPKTARKLTLTTSRLNGNSMAKPVKPMNVTSQSTVSNQIQKRKTLLDDDDLDTSLFDEFDFDTVGSQIPILPKRYTKRKKTSS